MVSQESSTAAAASSQLGDAWLSPELAKIVITRMVGVAGARYELDATQQDKFRDITLERWNSFLAKNQSRLRPLVGEFLQLGMVSEREKETRLADWVHRATPLLHELRKEFNAAAVDLRTQLDPNVQAKFDADVAKLDGQLMLSERQVQRWCTDYFSDPVVKNVTEKSEPREGHETREAGKKRNNKPRPVAPDQISIELDAWTLYVQNFMRTMDLNVGQRDAVLSVLSELKRRAQAHRDRRREEINKLERAIASFQGSAAELKQLQQQLTELYGPIDSMFGELKQRIEQVPTATQQDKAKTPEH
jgi:hypothetical protein